MEIVCIEKKTFEAMMARFETFARKMERLINRNTPKGMEKWFDSQDVCQILRISKRTLQSLRSEGTLPFTRLDGKVWYKPQDVERLIKSSDNSKVQGNG